MWLVSLNRRTAMVLFSMTMCEIEPLSAPPKAKGLALVESVVKEVRDNYAGKVVLAQDLDVF